MRTFFLLLFFAGAYAATAQTDFANRYAKYNSDRTLRLEYIENVKEYTIVHVAYTGTSNIGGFTGLYLNNFRIIDRTTGIQYRPTDADYLPTSSSKKFFLYNSGKEMGLEIYFDRLPSYVKEIDLVENDGDPSATYNFTFRNLRLNPEKDDSESLYDWLYDVSEPNYICAYTYDNVSIDIWIDDAYVGQLDRKFNDRSYEPSCGEYGTIMIGFPDYEARNFKASAKSGSNSYSWNFSFEPSYTCSKKNLKISSD